ncbi:phosphatidylinositol 3,4,5-trisphosphate-dependent Rac exchanger 1 protein-like isoform X1 [Clavelina lepadiformis]|uniref:phosphatidylinositol 3,4,5-trisphosphate-dependent Rac exchanger 1 protein-like isoform X1 n=2 Tax=Clavelina lepadiformis TaxID=159417 RepID=UPI0040411A43
MSVMMNENFSNQFKIRSSIIKAIVDNEEQYVETLKFIAKVMKTDLENCAEKIEYEVNDGHVRAVFGNITDLLEVHGARLNALRNEIQVVEKQAVNEDVVIFGGNSNIGEFFVKSRTTFSLYEVYCSNYNRAENVTKDLLEMPSLESVFESWNTSSHISLEKMGGLKILQFYLKTPLNYLCKTNVLLKALAVFTAITNSDLSDVISAYTITYATIMSIETTTRLQCLQEAYRIFDQLQQEWDNAGLCNKQGFLTKRGGNVKSWKIRWFTLRSNELKYFDEPVDEKALNTLDVCQCKCVCDTDNRMKPNCFGLVFDDRTYFIYATNQSEKVEWMNLLSWKIYMRQTPEEKARLALSIPALGHTTTVLDLLKVKNQ